MLERVQDRGRSWLAEQLSRLTIGRALDVGCGNGRHLAAGVAGIDVDPRRIRSAWERSRLVAIADAQHLPFRDGAFGTAYAIRMLNATGHVDQVLDEICRVLASNGRLLVYTRARTADGDRLGPENGAKRLAAHFRAVRASTDPDEPGGMLFIAER